MNDELRIVVMRSEELSGYPVTAVLSGVRERCRGHGKTVEDALADLFTGRVASEHARALESSTAVGKEPSR